MSTVQQFRVTLSPSCTIDVCGSYTPAEALQAARDAMEGCYSGQHDAKVMLCKADARGSWVAFEDVTPGALNPETAARQQRLLSWINTHDCGVQPCGIARADGAMIIQVAFVEADGSEGVEVTTVHTMAEARDALGY